MAFRSIKVLADEVLRNAEKVRAASIAQPARDLGDGPTGEETISPSTLFADAPAPSGSGMGLDARRGNSARPSSGAKVKEPSPNERPVLRVVSNRCLDTAKPAVKARSPRAAVSRHLVLIGGTDHARSLSRTG